MVIVDEAHHLKNRKSVAWQFVNALNKKYMLLLSATPVQNSLEELYNLITLIRPGQLKTYSYFKKNFIADKSGLEVKNKSKLKELMASAMIRNRRSQVDIKFTKRFATTKSLKSTEAERALYEDISAFVRKEYDSGILSKMALKNIQERIGSCPYAAALSIESLLNNDKFTKAAKGQMTMFHRASEALAQEPSVKMLELAKLLREFDAPMLVFTKYRTTLNALGKFLRQENFDVAEFHGSMRRAEKEAQIGRFRDGANVLISTETGGEGRNLQFCNGLVNFDLPWNPMAIEQRIGRIHRIGQEQDVYVFNLCAQDTVEHHILQILDKKINMFELAVGEVDMILGDLQEEQDFSEMVMDFWVRSESNEDMERDMENLGERLLNNKHHLERVKELDDTLFEG
jgi:SNF2 family DNA or RNA helicase